MRKQRSHTTMLVDEIIIKMKAGNGGDGVVRWRHEKSKEYSGPSGGNGGRGGSVFVRGVKDIGLLARYRNVPLFSAEDGRSGMKDSRQGEQGKDFILDLPVGSVVTNLSTRERVSIDEPGQVIPVLQGGAGGLGNEHFKGATNTRPSESTPGKPGEEADFAVELELIADGGLIGLPNAGKSSLLNALTNSKAKVGSYEFTTLEPNLGDFHGIILADIPGLIEGASEGKGLGVKFLKHIRRTRRLFHLIAADSLDIAAAYTVIRSELASFDKALAEKPETVILSKSDTVSPEQVKAAAEEVRKLSGSEPLAVTVLDDESVKALGSEISRILAST